MHDKTSPMVATLNHDHNGTFRDEGEPGLLAPGHKITIDQFPVGSARPLAYDTVVKQNPITDLGEYNRYDDMIKQLVDSMKYKLYRNRHKGSLEDVNMGELLTLLRREVDELEDALQRKNQIEMILEAADVANFALAVIVRALKEAAGK